jgi:MFS family permease
MAWFYSEMSPTEKRALWASTAGWVLDSMDLMFFSMVLPTLIVLWGLTNAQAGALGTTALLSSAFGGWISGMLCDRVGRVRMLQISILWFAIATALCGLTNSAPQLMVARAIQGLGFGGEWSAGAVLIAEIIQPAHRGKALGIMQGGFQIGFGIAALTSTMLFSILPPEIAWRAVFFVGLVPALLVFYVRRAVPEPAIFEKAKEIPSSIFAIFSPKLLPKLVLTSLFCLGLCGGALSITLWLPTYLKRTLGLSVFDEGSYLLVAILGGICGCIASGYLADRVGRRKNFLIFAAGALIIIFAYTHLPISGSVLLAAGFPLLFFSQGIFGAVGPFLSEQYPTRVRAAAQGFSYNFGRAAGSIFPTVVGMLSAEMPLGRSIGLVSLVGYVLLMISACLLPETRAQDLSALDAEMPIGVSREPAVSAQA